MPSVLPILNDVTDGVLIFRDMSGADAPLRSVTHTDGLSDGNKCSLLNYTDNITDGYLSVGEADDIYQGSFPVVASFFKTCLI